MAAILWNIYFIVLGSRYPEDIPELIKYTLARGQPGLRWISVGMLQHGVQTTGSSDQEPDVV